MTRLSTSQIQLATETLASIKTLDALLTKVRNSGEDNGYWELAMHAVSHFEGEGEEVTEDLFADSDDDSRFGQQIAVLLVTQILARREELCDLISGFVDVPDAPGGA